MAMAAHATMKITTQSKKRNAKRRKESSHHAHLAPNLFLKNKGQVVPNEEQINTAAAFQSVVDTQPTTPAPTSAQKKKN